MNILFMSCKIATQTKMKRMIKLTKLDNLMKEQMGNNTFDMKGELAKQMNDEVQNHIKALDVVKRIAVMNADEDIPANEVADMFDLPVNEINLLAYDYADELTEDGCFNGWFTRRSIIRLSMCAPSDSILAEKIRNYILNTAC